jgi:hypothetical protein
MRRILISILLAGAAASPALAQDHGGWRHAQSQGNSGDRGDRGDRSDRGDRGQAQQERQQVREQVREQVRAERSNGGANFERSQQARPERAMPQFEGRQQQVQDVQRGGFDRSRFEGRNNGPRIVEVPQQGFDRSTRNWNRDRGDQSGDRSNWSGDRTQRSGGASGWTRTQNGWARTGGDYRQGEVAQQRVRDRSRWSSGGWDRNWRDDHRYDWRSRRDRHRSIFHLGIYFDPFGYGYRSYDIGYRMVPAYYGQQYWIDPGLYGLPYPPPGTAWVRYWNDAVLVDIYSGEVVDVIHNFFW